MNKALELGSHGEPPSKKARHLSEESAGAGPDDSVQDRRTSRRNKDAGGTADTTKSTRGTATKGLDSNTASMQDEEDQAPSDIESEIERASVMGENNDDTVASVNGDADGYVYRILIHGYQLLANKCECSYESPTTQIPPEIQNFPLSKARLNKNNIVYSDEHTLCVRIREKMVRRAYPPWETCGN